MELFAADGHDAGGCERVTGEIGNAPVPAVDSGGPSAPRRTPRTIPRRRRRSLPPPGPGSDARRRDAPRSSEGSAVVTHIGDGCRAAGFLPIAMAVKCTKLDRAGRVRIPTFATGWYGVALLMDCGMPAWLKTISTICLPSVGPPPAGNGDLKLTPPVRSEMARVLASLVLSRVAEGVSP